MAEYLSERREEAVYYKYHRKGQKNIKIIKPIHMIIMKIKRIPTKINYLLDIYLFEVNGRP